MSRFRVSKMTVFPGIDSKPRESKYDIIEIEDTESNKMYDFSIEETEQLIVSLQFALDNAKAIRVQRLEKALEE